MTEEKITPEEKLLKIIENPAIEKQKVFAPAKAIRQTTLNVHTLLHGILTHKNFHKYISLQAITKVLMGLCVLITIFAVYNYFVFGNEIKKKFEKIISDIGIYEPGSQKQIFPEPNIGDIIAGYRVRNMFSFLPVTSTGTTAAQKEISQLVSTLKLVGVIWSENPQAMIEDVPSNKTYLVNTGEYVGALKVNKILRNSVVLGKDKEEYELR